MFNYFLYDGDFAYRRITVWKYYIHTGKKALWQKSKVRLHRDFKALNIDASIDFYLDGDKKILKYFKQKHNITLCFIIKTTIEETQVWTPELFLLLLLLLIVTGKGF